MFVRGVVVATADLEYHTIPRKHYLILIECEHFVGPIKEQMIREPVTIEHTAERKLKNIYKASAALSTCTSQRLYLQE